MTRLSVVVPSYHDPLLFKTVASLIDSTSPETEIIVVLDGYQTEVPIHPKVKVIYFPHNVGMRGAMNAGITASEAQFIMKSDSHCIFDMGFDRVLMEQCKENWLMIPRRYSLDDQNWVRNLSRPIRDYHYYNFLEEDGRGLFAVPWGRKDRMGLEYNIDDTMCFQGSCWFADRKYYLEHVGKLDDRLETYGTFCGDQAEIGLKYWLNGGEIKVNKNTWYAHLQKTKRHYQSGDFVKSYKSNKLSTAQWVWTAKHWLHNEEPGMKYKFSWLVEKFHPVPGWPEGWKDL
jgi:glycosyltransferase involved in cell wall biosynthesis